MFERNLEERGEIACGNNLLIFAETWTSLDYIANIME